MCINQNPFLSADVAVFVTTIVLCFLESAIIVVDHAAVDMTAVAKIVSIKFVLLFLLSLTALLLLLTS